jgi:hypothetical protein
MKRVKKCDHSNVCRVLRAEELALLEMPLRISTKPEAFRHAPDQREQVSHWRIRRERRKSLAQDRIVIKRN